MSGTIHDYLAVGNRVFLPGKGAATIINKDLHWPEDIDDGFGYRIPSSWYGGPDYIYSIQFDKLDGKVVEDVKSTDSQYRLYDGLTFVKDSGYKIGETFEVEREGLEPNLRGRLLEIDETAEMWPYKIGQEGGVAVWFGYREIRKIHSVTSAERSPRAKEVLKAQIQLKREELEALETALEVLEYTT